MTPHYADDQVTLYAGQALEVLRTLPDESLSACLTSPPYWGLRDYQIEGQYGLERTPEEYVDKMVAVFAEVRRILAPDGTLWLNIADSYANDEKWGGRSGGKHVEALHGETNIGRARRSTGLPPKSLTGIPWRMALALQADGWTLRSDIIWHKPNAMPESIVDRPSASHEHVFLFAKQPRYWFNLDPIREPILHPKALDGTRVFGGRLKGTGGGIGGTERRRGHNVYGGATPPGADRPKGAGADGWRHTAAHPKGRNPGDVWSLPTQPFPAAHFATMAPALAERCLKAGLKPGGVALDPFCGVGTTGMAALKLGGRFVGIDLDPKALDLALRTRLAQTALIDAEEMQS